MDMEEMDKFIDTNNKKELLRIYESRLKDAKTEEEKTKFNNAIADVKEKLSKLEQK